MRAFVTLAAFYVSCTLLMGQAGRLDPDFNRPEWDTPFIPTELNGTVTKYFPMADGRVIAIGTFSQGIVRFRADGILDSSFPGPGIFGGFVKDLAFLPDGKMLIVGNFVTPTRSYYLARLHSDGTVDQTFANHFIPSGNFDHIQVGADGNTVMLSGTFTGISLNNGAVQPRDRFALFTNSDGLLLSTTGGFNGTVSTVFKDAQGRFVCTGAFTQFNGTSAPGIFRLDPNFNADASFSVGLGLTGNAPAVGQQADGKYILGGDITAYDGVATQRLIRLEPNGSLDETFQPGAFDNSILALAVGANDVLYVGGSFLNYNGIAQQRLLALNTDGSLNQTFEVAIGLNNAIKSILPFGENGYVLIGGDFTNFKGVNRRNPLILNANGNRVINNGSGVAGGTILRMAEQPDGKVIIAGTFTQVRGANRNRIARLNVDGTLDLTFQTGSGFDGDVAAIAIQPDGKIVLGGNFSQFNGQAQVRLIRLHADGTKDDTFQPIALNNGVSDLLLEEDGKLYVTGSFGLQGGNGLVRLNADGSRDESFSTLGGSYGAVRRIQKQADGKIIIAGEFTSFNGVGVSKVARIHADGTLDETLATLTGGVGFDFGNVYALQTQSDGKIILGGNFSYYQRSGVIHYSRALIRLNADGTYDDTFQYANGFNINASVNDVLLHPSGVLVVAGNFGNYGNFTTNRIAFFDSNGTFDTNSTTGSGFDGLVNDLLVRSNGQLLVGALFSKYNGVEINGMAQLENPCESDVTTEMNLCEGDVYVFGEIEITEAGEYIQVFTNQLSCDSLVTLQVNLIPTLFERSHQMCRFDTLEYGGQVFTEFGEFQVSIPVQGGCDSLVTLTIVQAPAEELAVQATICSAETYVYTAEVRNEAGELETFQSPELTEAGTYTYTLLLGENGCETNVTVELTVLPHEQVEIAQDFCGEDFEFGDEVISGPGVYTQVFETATGCDSTVVLTVARPVESLSFDEETRRLTANPSGYSSYRLYRGEELVDSSRTTGQIDYEVEQCGEYSAVFGWESGCNLGMNITKQFSGCSATIDVTLENAAFPVTVNVAHPGAPNGVNHIRDSPSFSFPGACPAVYTILVTDANGCQVSLILDYFTAQTQWAAPSENSCLAYSPAVVIDQLAYRSAVSLCEGETFLFGSQMLSESGVFTETFQNQLGCDSVVMVDLTVLPREISTLAYDSTTRRLTISNDAYTSFKLYRNNEMVQSSASTSTIDYLAEECGDYYAEFGTVSCNISINGFFSGNANFCNRSFNITVTDAAFPVSWRFSNASTVNLQTGVSASGQFSVFSVCSSSQYGIEIEDANGCTQSVVINPAVSVFSVEGGEPDAIPVCPASTNVVTIQHPQESLESATLCAGETLLFGDQEIIASGQYSHTFLSASGCDSTVVLTVEVLPATSIVMQPVSLNLCESSSAQLMVDAVGSELNYQWYKDEELLPNAIDAALTFDALTFADAGSYYAVIQGACGTTVISDTVSVTVNPAPAILQQPISLTVCEGEEAAFSIQVSAETASDFQWRRNGEVIPDATGTSLLLSDVDTTVAGDYTVQFQDACGLAVSAIARLTVISTTAILNQPTDYELCEGEELILQVQATGAQLAYEWSKNGDVVPNATAASLRIAQVSQADSGTYVVKISGACGEDVVSQTVAVSVKPVTRIAQGLAAQNVCVGEPVSLAVQVLGTAPFTYVWKKDGELIDGATSATYALPAATLEMAGTYTVDVTGACGGMVSSQMVLTVNSPVAISAPPVAVDQCEGTSAALTATIAGDVMGLQWKKDGDIVPGATSASLSFPSLTPDQAGEYVLEIIGACNTLQSPSVSVLVDSLPVITSQPQSVSVCPSADVTLRAVVAGDEAATYVWYMGEEIFATTDSPELVLPGVATSGSYTLKVTGACGVAESQPAVVSVQESTAILQEPTATVVCAGESLVLSVVAQGDDLTYQWQQDGMDIPNATSASFSVAESTVDNAGDYQVIITGACGTITSTQVAVTVNVPSSEMLTAEICNGEVYVFGDQSLNATGEYVLQLTGANGCDSTVTLNLTVKNVVAPAVSVLGTTLSVVPQTGATYQWINCATEALVPGATASTLEVETSGQYAVQVTVDGCSVVSDCASVLILGANMPMAVNVFPNPFVTELSITVGAEAIGSELSLHSLDGKVLYRQIMKAGEQKIDVAHLNAGIYLLHINGSEGKAVYQLVKTE